MNRKEFFLYTIIPVAMYIVTKFIIEAQGGVCSRIVPGSFVGMPKGFRYDNLIEYFSTGCYTEILHPMVMHFFIGLSLAGLIYSIYRKKILSLLLNTSTLLVLIITSYFSSYIPNQYDLEPYVFRYVLILFVIVNTFFLLKTKKVSSKNSESRDDKLHKGESRKEAKDFLKSLLSAAIFLFVIFIEVVIYLGIYGDNPFALMGAVLVPLIVLPIIILIAIILNFSKSITPNQAYIVEVAIAIAILVILYFLML